MLRYYECYIAPTDSGYRGGIIVVVMVHGPPIFRLPE